MGIAGKIGKAALGLGAGGIAFLGALKARDDRYVAGVWQSLEVIARGSGVPFEEEMVAGLPEPARRYFLHAIRPGTPLASGFRWRYHGGLRTGRDAPWMDLRAEQTLVRDRGFVWKATVARPPLLMTGADHYLDGESRMRISAFGLVPVVNASGPDIARSASARLLIEGVALPPALLPRQGVTIEPVDESRFRALVRLGEWQTPITVKVDEVGRATEVVLESLGRQHARQVVPADSLRRDARRGGDLRQLHDPDPDHGRLVVRYARLPRGDPAEGRLDPVPLKGTDLTPIQFR